MQFRVGEAAEGASEDEAVETGEDAGKTVGVLRGKTVQGVPFSGVEASVTGSLRKGNA